jgi:cell cycle checkpoint protein
MRAMSVGNKVSVRTDGEGVLSLNFMVDVEGKNVFIEFKVVPNVEEGSDEE